VECGLEPKMTIVFLNAKKMKTPNKGSGNTGGGRRGNRIDIEGGIGVGGKGGRGSPLDTGRSHNHILLSPLWEFCFQFAWSTET
jgi:hypothetical protein